MSPQPKRGTTARPAATRATDAPGEPSARSVRAFVRSRTRGPSTLLDRYVAMFGLAMVAAVAGRPVSSAIAGMAGQAGAAHVGAGMALIVLAFAGVVAAARAGGPVVLSAADAAWLLLSPLDRRGVLGRTARVLLLVAIVAGVALGLGLLAVLGAPDQLIWRLAGAMVLGVSASVGAMAMAVLAQLSQTWNAWLSAALVVLLAMAVLAASGTARSVLAAVAGAPLSAVSAVAVGSATVATLLVRRAWTTLDRIPARSILATSTRAGHVAAAAVVVDPGALTWIAEDNHWRARKLRSRAWPSLPAPFALAWQDWRRAARRPGRLAAVFAATALPAVLAQAGNTGAAEVSVLAGALWVAAANTSGARRDGDNPSLMRLMGVGPRAAMAARALLPALLCGAWTAAALAGLAMVGGLPAGAWWLFGPLISPAVAAAGLRMARRRPVDHSMPVIDTPGGAIPTGPLIWALTGPDLALIGCLPLIAALTTRPAGLAEFLGAQAVLGVAVLAGYLVRVRSVDNRN
ncbi:DUF6297 family protein [Nonomuraea sp. NPDC026600]|uniref:DUF6297 family protein n=1 Tax=Nonomuraea sp. NPDC026600 TaxID=3155363 RepID=UPI00340F7EDA